MARTGRDSQRQKVYDAEAWSAGREFGSGPEGLAEIEAYYRKLLSQKTLRRRFGEAMCSGQIAVIGGGSTRASYHRGRGEPFASKRRRGLSDHAIMFAASNRNELVALHELAHHLTRNAAEPHGWEFAAAYLWLVRNRLGAEEARKLREAFRRTGARYTAPRAKRQLSPEQAEAARARLAEIRQRQAAKREAETGEWLIQKYDRQLAEEARDRQTSAAIYEFGSMGGAGRHRMVTYWSPWPPNATVWKLRSSAEKWAEIERTGWAAGVEREIEISVVSKDEAMANYEKAVADRNRRLGWTKAAASQSAIGPAAIDRLRAGEG